MSYLWKRKNVKIDIGVKMHHTLEGFLFIFFGFVLVTISTLVIEWIFNKFFY